MTTNKWILPALGFVLLTGLLGVTIKLALRDVKWPEILIWTAIVYAVLALGSIVLTGNTLHLNRGAPWALLSGIAAAVGLICSFIALRHAKAVVAVPVMSAYPVVTLLASVAFLRESISLTRAAGVALVLTGVVLLTR
jgi:uncharacterized membrane protein